MHRQGYGVMRIVEQTGLSYPTVRGVIDRYDTNGAASIKPARRGNLIGTGRSLTQEQEDLIQSNICDKRSEQLKMDFALWSRAAVMQLIERECGVVLPVRTVGKSGTVGFHAAKAD